MNTHPDRQFTPDDTVGEHWWPRLVDHINAWWIQRQPLRSVLRKAATIAPVVATVAIVAGLAALAVGVLWLAWWLITSVLHAIDRALTDAGDGIRHAAHTGTDHVAGWSLTRTITDPVRGYLTQHATGLPVTAHTLWITWLAVTIGLFILATIGFRGARIGWTLLGAATTAMVYLGTPANSAPLAAGLTVTAWAVLSIAAFNRTTTIPIDLSLPVPPRRLFPRPEPLNTD